MNKLGITLAHVLVLVAACGASAPPPEPTGLPDRSVLDGESSSPMASGEANASFSASAGGAREGGWNGAIQSLATELAKQLRWDGHDRMKVAVLDFVPTHGGECALGAPAAEDLTTNLFQTNKFEIIERRMLDRILQENQASQSDLYDPQHTARLGGLLGVDGIVTGTVTASTHGYSFNTRVIIAESGGVASAARVNLSRSDADGRGTCGDGRQIIEAPPIQ